MTNGECIYRKTVDYMSRMALEKDDFRRFSMIWEFRVTGNWVAARVAYGWKWAFKNILPQLFKPTFLSPVQCFLSGL